MSLLENNLKSASSSSLVEKILEQGQRLRNSMVQAVLNNDPFNTEILNSYNNSPRTNLEIRNVDSARFPTCDGHVESKKPYTNSDLMRIQRYLRGEDMCMNEEIKALETLRSMSPNSLIQSTSCFKTTCHYKDSCDICKEYESRIFSGNASSSSIDTNRTVHTEKHTHTSRHKLTNKHVNHDHHIVHERSREISPKIKSQENTTERKSTAGSQIKGSSSKLKAVKQTFHENQNLLKYVDSLKVNVYSLKLNSAGSRKVMATENLNKPFLSSSNTYFIEYTLPDLLTKSIPKSRAKVNTGLNPDKTVRFCSKKLQSETVYFKQQSIHQISNINVIDLSSVKLEFRVSYRSVKQKTALFIGKATFNLGYVVTNRFFTGEQELVLLSENIPVVLGHLKVSLQFGCDKLYFGKEFIDAISCSKENSNLSESDSFHKLSDNEQPPISKPEKILTTTNQNITQTETRKYPTESNNKTELSNKIESSNKTEPSNKTVTTADKNVAKKTDDETPLLYALIHVSEVRLLTKSLNSYVICRGFSRDDTVTSKTVYNDFKPIFNLYQIIPVLLDEDFINRLRDNYIIVEVWEKKVDAVDNLLGLTKLSLHQLYVAYRNPLIVKHLAKNQNPIIGVDWWEPITCPISNTETGQLRALVALGSSSQIETLEQNRGLKHFTEKNPPKFIDIVDDHRLQTSLSLNSDYNSQSKLPPVVHFELPGRTLEVTSDKSLRRAPSFETTDDSNYFSKHSDRIHKSTSFDKEYNRNSAATHFERGYSRVPSLEKINETNYISDRPEKIDRSTSFDKTFERTDDTNYSKPVARETISEKNTHRISSFENLSNRDNLSNTNLNKRTILVSDKYVQQPEIEISPSITSIEKIAETTYRSKIDASTQSEITEMDSEKDNKTSTINSQFTQRDFLNSFFEQLLSARDLSQRNRHVENSTNTENLIPENTAQTTLPDNKTSTTVSSTGTQNDPNMNKSHVLNTTFPQNSITSSNMPVRNTSDLLDSLQKALLVGNNKNNLDDNNENDISDSFKAHIVIENALHLPSRKKCKSKRNKTRSPKSNEEILPSTYVTFKGCSESDFLVTSVIPKSTSPRWDYRCDIQLPSDLLLNNQKRLIFKVWRKANGPSLQPNFQTDVVLGFAALDLTVLLSGLPNVQGWFNIVDFSSKCNGQIKIHITPLENLSKFNEYKRSYVPEKHRIETPVNLTSVPQKEPEHEVNDDSIPSEFLSRALKRKFTELDEITQRLRQRLSAVTNDDSDVSNDDFIDDFERDLNTICVETEPFNFLDDNINVDGLKNSVEIATSSKVNSTSDLLTSLNVEPLINFSSRNSESGSSATVSEVNVPTVQENLNKLDTHLNEGKIKIDSLLEKLSLLTGDNEGQNKSDRSFSSRYVSGCSINQEPETSNQVLKDIGIERTGNVDPDLIFNPLLFQQMFTASLDSTPRLDSLELMSSVHCTTLKNLVEDSTSSGSTRDLQSVSSNSLSESNISRQAPDGAGNMSND